MTESWYYWHLVPVNVPLVPRRGKMTLASPTHAPLFGPDRARCIDRRGAPGRNNAGDNSDDTKQ